MLAAVGGARVAGADDGLGDALGPREIARRQKVPLEEKLRKRWH